MNVEGRFLNNNNFVSSKNILLSLQGQSRFHFLKTFHYQTNSIRLSSDLKNVIKEFLQSGTN